MAIHTIKLYQIERDKKFNLFDFEYPFYDESHRKEFEKKFFMKFFNREIEFETIGLFKRYLQSILTLNAERFAEYYKSECESAEQRYLYNKDLVEETTRITEGTSTGSQNSTNQNNNNSNSIDNLNSEYKLSDVGNGVSDVNNLDRLTSNSKTTDNNTSNTESNSISNSNTTDERNNTQTETLIYKSYGNIGVTTGADLKLSWQNAINPTDEYIFKYLEPLFCKVYN